MALSERPVTIRLEVHKESGGATVEDLHVEPSVRPMRGLGKAEEVVWKSKGRLREFTINFNYPELSPFGWTSKSSTNGELHSGEPNVGGGVKTSYGYTITANLPASGGLVARTLNIDPEVVIDDSTPPPGTHGGGHGGGQGHGHGQGHH